MCARSCVLCVYCYSKSRLRWIFTYACPHKHTAIYRKGPQPRWPSSLSYISRSSVAQDHPRRELPPQDMHCRSPVCACQYLPAWVVVSTQLPCRPKKPHKHPHTQHVARSRGRQRRGPLARERTLPGREGGAEKCTSLHGGRQGGT